MHLRNKPKIDHSLTQRDLSGAQDNVVRSRKKRIESKRKAMILSSRHNFGQQIRNHILGDAVIHHHVAKGDIAADQVMPNLQVSYIP